MNRKYLPGEAHGARVLKDGEKWTLILIRELRHAPEKVWQALIDPQQIREWAPYDASGSLGVVGASLKLTTVAAPTVQEADCVVKRADRPRLLEYNWGENEMRWELEPLGDGTRLTLWHSIDRRFVAMGAAGWHICLDVMDRLVGDEAVGRIVGSEAMKFEWARLHKEYAKQFETRPNA